MTTSDHFDGDKFHNLKNVNPSPFSQVPRMMSERGVPWPPSVPVVPQVPAPLGDATAVVTFIGHATFLIQTGAGNIITDPIYADIAGPLNLAGPRRSRAPGVRFEDLPPISTILLSHNHYDHCDIRTLRRLRKRFDPLVITPVGNARFARRAGLKKVEELDWWDTAGRRGPAGYAAHRRSTFPRAHCGIAIARCGADSWSRAGAPASVFRRRFRLWTTSSAHSPPSRADRFRDAAWRV